MTYKLFALGALSMALTACVSVTPLAPAGSKVVVTSNTPPASCHLLKGLTEDVTNGVDMHYRSHHEIQMDQMNRLRNDTASLGGNLFVVRSHATTYQPISTKMNEVTISEKVSASDHAMVDSHAITGDVYLCDAKGLAVVKSTPSEAKKISDIQVSGE